MDSTGKHSGDGDGHTLQRDVYVSIGRYDSSVRPNGLSENEYRHTRVHCRHQSEYRSLA